MLLALLLLATNNRQQSFFFCWCLDVDEGTNIYVDSVFGRDNEESDDVGIPSGVAWPVTSSLGWSRSRPFRTLHRAAEALAAARHDNVTQLTPGSIVTVHVAPGEYLLDRTLHLDARHSHSLWKTC